VTAPSRRRVLVVGSITRDTNVFSGVTRSGFGGTALFAARTYLHLGVAVRLVTRLAADDIGRIDTALPGVELIAQPSDATTAFENTYGANDARSQRVTALAAPITFEAGYLADVDWLHLGPLHPQDLSDDWLRQRYTVPLALDMQGFARSLNNERITTALDARLVELLPDIQWLKASRVEWRTLQAHLGIGPLERPPAGAIESLVTEGLEGGVVLRGGQRDVRWSAAPPVPDCDPTGAGDVFLAAYVCFRFARGASAHRSAAEAARITSDVLLARQSAG
jgi:sugar/nucleoside kinase (ribokinase family)